MGGKVENKPTNIPDSPRLVDEKPTAINKNPRKFWPPPRLDEK